MKVNEFGSGIIMNPEETSNKAKAELKIITDHLEGNKDFVKNQKRGANIVDTRIVRAMASYEYKGFDVVIDVYSKDDKEGLKYDMSVMKGNKYLHDPKYNVVPDPKTMIQYLDELTTMEELNEEAVSKAQQALFGIALSVKRDEQKIDEVPAEHREKVQDIVDGMTEEEIKKMASTSTEDLPDTVEESLKKNRMPSLQNVYESEASLDSVPGRGEMSMGNDTSDSSDNTKGSGEVFGKPKKKTDETTVDIDQYKARISELTGGKYDDNNMDQYDIVVDCFAAGESPEDCIKKLELN
jgi:hypothetical protein